MRTDYVTLVDVQGPVGKGQCGSVYARCIDSSGQLVRVVLKAECLGDTTRQKLVSEAIGCSIARKTGVYTAEPLIVRIGERGAQWLQKFSARDSNPGYGHATIHLLRAEPYKAGEAIPKPQVKEALRAFSTDVYCMNGDRKEINPNCGTHDGKLWIYDYDCSFHAVAHMKHSAANKLTLHPDVVVQHRLSCLYRHLYKVRGIDAEPMVHAVASLDAAWRLETLANLPEPWHEVGYKMIVYLAHLHENAEKIGRGVKDVLTWS